MKGTCEFCGKENTELYDIGSMLVCGECRNNDTINMLINEDINPSFNDFAC